MITAHEKLIELLSLYRMHSGLSIYLSKGCVLVMPTNEFGERFLKQNYSAWYNDSERMLVFDRKIQYFAAGEKRADQAVRI